MNHHWKQQVAQWNKNENIADWIENNSIQAIISKQIDVTMQIFYILTLLKTEKLKPTHFWPRETN